MLLIFNSSAQKKVSLKKQRKIVAAKQINELKNGVLFVRLKTKQKTIEAMKKSGKESLAKKTAYKLKNRNLIITKSFKNYFDFCPVYFFYSSDSKHVRNNNLDSIIFLNDDLSTNKSITITNPTIFIAEFGNIEPNQTITYQSTSHVPATEKRNTYNGGTNFSFKAVVIKDEMFNQLQDPFPYYQRESSGLKEEKHIKGALLALNARLHKFYKNQHKK